MSDVEKFPPIIVREFEKIDPIDLTEMRATAERLKLNQCERVNEILFQMGDQPMSCKDRNFDARLARQERTDPYNNYICQLSTSEFFEGLIEAMEFVKLDSAMCSDFEIFSLWERPEIILFDFRNSERQSAHFDRISYYIENSEQDALTSDEFINHLTVVGAYCDPYGQGTECGLGVGHDFSSESLADFFNLQSLGFRLTPEEDVLLDRLLMAGILSQDSSIKYVGQEAMAVVSTVRTYEPEYRQVIMFHELHHGYYFSDDSYKSAMDQAWHNLDENDKKVLKTILYYSGGQYNIDDFDLLRSEAAAYSLEPQNNLDGWEPMLKSALSNYDQQSSRNDLLTKEELLKMQNNSSKGDFFHKLNRQYSAVASDFDLPLSGGK